MTAVTFATPSDAWFATVSGLLNLEGFVVSPRGQRTVEYPGPQMFRVERPWEIPIVAHGRDFRDIIGLVEGLSLVGQTSIPEIILDKVAAFRPFMRRSIFWGAYGPRVAGGVGQIVDLLAADPDSRQAVLTLFDASRDLGRTEQVDLPCTIALQYQIRRGKLEAWTVMRSNDAWLGLPYDLMQFGMLQAAIAEGLAIPMGPMTHSAGSMHLYERNRLDAMGILGSDISRSFGPGIWGGDGTIDSTASRARRLLLGQASRLGHLTDFEAWAAELIAE